MLGPNRSDLAALGLLTSLWCLGGCIEGDPTKVPASGRSAQALVGLPNLIVRSVTRDLAASTVEVEVCNTGVAPMTFGATLMLYVSSQGQLGYPASYFIDPLAPSTCFFQSVSCTNFSDSGCGSAFGVAATVDTWYAEADETDNQREVWFGSQLDVIPASLTRDVNGYVLSLCNERDFDLPYLGFSVSRAPFTYDNTVSDQMYMPAHSCVDWPFACSFASGSGDCTESARLIVEIDPFASTVEADELNNVLEFNFRAEADLSIRLLGRTQGVGYSYEVCNNGEANAEGVEIQFSNAVPGNSVSQPVDYLANLGGHQCEQRVVPCGFVGDGTCTDLAQIVARVANPSRPEEDLTNNWDTVTFGSETDLRIGGMSRSPAGYVVSVCNDGASWQYVLATASTSSPQGWGIDYPVLISNVLLGGGTCEDLVLPCGAVGDGSCSDRSSWIVDVDPESWVIESDETNNTRSFGFAAANPTGRPNHWVESLEFDSATDMIQVEICADVPADYFSFVDVDVATLSTEGYWVSLGRSSGYVDGFGCAVTQAQCWGNCPGGAMLWAGIAAIYDNGYPGFDDDPSDDAIIRQFGERADLRVAAVERSPSLGTVTVRLCNEGASDYLRPIWTTLYHGHDFGLQSAGSMGSGSLAAGSCVDFDFDCALVGDGSCVDPLDLYAVAWSDGPLPGPSPEFDDHPENDFLLRHFDDAPDLRVAQIDRDPDLGSYLVQICNDGVVTSGPQVGLELDHRTPSTGWSAGPPVSVLPIQAGDCGISAIPCGLVGDQNCTGSITVRALVYREGFFSPRLDANPANDSLLRVYDDRPDLRIGAITRDASLGEYAVEVCNDSALDGPGSVSIELQDLNVYGGGAWALVPPISAASCELISLPCAGVGDSTCQDPIMVRAGLVGVVDNNGSNDFAFQAFDLRSSPEIVGEVDRLSFAQSGFNGWQSVVLGHTYLEPVVVANVISYNGSDPAHARVRNVTGGGFELQVEEWDYLDGNHATEDVPYLVVEAGRHVLLPQESVLEAGRAQIGKNWTTVNFSQPFPAAPTLLVGIMSDNDPAAVVVRVRNVTASGFEAQVQEQESTRSSSHPAETVGWVAMTSGPQEAAGMYMLAGETAQSIRNGWSTLNLQWGLPDPIFLANMTTTSGGDTAGLRYRNLTATSVQVTVEEERSRDSEVNHADERVAWCLFSEAGPLIAN